MNAPELFESDASSMGPQTRTVPSSDADASMLGNLGFQWTQLTVLLWPSSTAIGISRLECQMYTLWSAKKIFNLELKKKDCYNTPRIEFFSVCLCLDRQHGSQSSKKCFHLMARLRYGARLRFLSYTEIGNRDSSLSLCNTNMFCIVQCSHQVWNPIPSLSPSM